MSQIHQAVQIGTRIRESMSPLEITWCPHKHHRLTSSKSELTIARGAGIMCICSSSISPTSNLQFISFLHPLAGLNLATAYPKNSSFLWTPKFQSIHCSAATILCQILSGLIIPRPHSQAFYGSPLPSRGALTKWPWPVPKACQVAPAIHVLIL